VDLAAGKIVHPIVAEVIGKSGTVLRDRVTVIAGDSIPDGELSPDAVALRIDEKGLEDLGPLVTSGVSLDPATLVPPYTWVGEAMVSPNPPPSISGFEVSTDPMLGPHPQTGDPGFVAGDITLYDLFFRLNIDVEPCDCRVNAQADTVLIEGDYGLEPLGADPERIDVSQLAGVDVGFVNFRKTITCSWELCESIVDSAIGSLQAKLSTEIGNYLNEVDPDNNTFIAAAVEDALGDVAIAGPAGEALGVDLEAPFSTIDEDDHGITLVSDAAVTASAPDPGAADLLASFHVDPVSPPSFGTLAPNGQPYDLALAMSASALNQLLKAEVESGLLITSISEYGGAAITLDTVVPTPLGPKTLGEILPELAVLGSRLLRFELYPTIAPIVTAEEGPAGELATLRLAHLFLTLVPVGDPSTTLLRVAADAEIGLDVDFSGGELGFPLGSPVNVIVHVLENPFHVNEGVLQLLFGELIKVSLPTVADSLGTFPLPAFPGLELTFVDQDRDGEYLSLFFDLTPASP